MFSIKKIHRYVCNLSFLEKNQRNKSERELNFLRVLRFYSREDFSVGWRCRRKRARLRLNRIARNPVIRRLC